MNEKLSPDQKPVKTQSPKVDSSSKRADSVKDEKTAHLAIPDDELILKDSASDMPDSQAASQPSGQKDEVSNNSLKGPKEEPVAIEAEADDEAEDDSENSSPDARSEHSN